MIRAAAAALCLAAGPAAAVECRLQLRGLAGALRNRAVARAFLALPAAPVRLSVFEWSGERYQRPLAGWVTIDGPAVLRALAARLEAMERQPAPPETALGAAMRHGTERLAQQPGCWRRVLDISGDGRHNAGPHPRDTRAALVSPGLTINALAIGSGTRDAPELRQGEIGQLVAYFEAWVILGPLAFVETASGFEDYERAMTRKLLRELQSVAVSSVR